MNCSRKDTVVKEEIYKLIDLVIDNSYFKVWNQVFRQYIGIPMGINPAPQMANLYLYNYEAGFMKKLTKENYGVAKKVQLHKEIHWWSKYHKQWWIPGDIPQELRNLP